MHPSTTVAATETRRSPTVRWIRSRRPSSSPARPGPRRARPSPCSASMERGRCGAGDDLVQGLAHLGDLPVERRRRSVPARLQLVERARRARLPDAPAQHVVEHEPQRVHVRPLIHLLAPGLLRGHVLDRAHHRARLGDVGVVQVQRVRRGQREGRATSPSGDPRRRAIPKSMISASVAVHHHVLRLEVAMDDARVVRRRHARRDPPGQRQRLRHGHRAPPLDERGEVSSLDVVIVMYLRPPDSPRSWMRTTFLWVTWRARSSSLLKRLT